MLNAERIRINKKHVRKSLRLLARKYGQAELIHETATLVLWPRGTEKQYHHTLVNLVNVDLEPIVEAVERSVAWRVMFVRGRDLWPIQ